MALYKISLEVLSSAYDTQTPALWMEAEPCYGLTLAQV